MPSYPADPSSILALLDGNELPPQFSYKPVVPFRRMSIVETSGDVVFSESPTFVDSDLMIAWECPASCKYTFDFFLGKYNVAPAPDYDFIGYWGDSYTVRFFVFDPPKVNARLWDLSGSFRVKTVNEYNGAYFSDPAYFY